MQIPVGPLTFDAQEWGAGDELVLLLHGFPQTSHEWRVVAPRLAGAGFRVVAPDLRGASPGARPSEVEAYAMPHLVDDVLGLLDGLGVERAHVVGHDWGAAVAWHVGARHPGRVRTLSAVSVPHPLAFRDALLGDEEQRAKSQYMRLLQAPGSEDALLAEDAAFLRSVFDGTDAVDVDAVVADMSVPGRLTGGVNWYRAMGDGWTDDLPPVTVPTLYVWSDGDQALGRTAAESTGSHVEGPYRFVELPGVSHWVPEEAPDALTEALLEHLRRG